ncbi:hypothetical protein O7635_10925 [Asanoa sp. WMMD1127]|uniref:hypothetical protein n=1 Tax=Asanoa sp. WMMD1127 TaxID=3016107 RepID=UPI002416AE2E|nr:hypothetical protein [Asanoa sp. WMMD1127]MDG4822361.1 hypothetical protein [Asanoa sp. WMMD1127]
MRTTRKLAVLAAALIGTVGALAVAPAAQAAAPPASLGTFQLLAAANYHYVNVAYESWPGEWDVAWPNARDPQTEGTHFTFRDAGDGDIAIVQVNGSLLTLVSEAEPLRWRQPATPQNPDEIVDAQRFRIVPNSDGTISLRNKVNGKHVSAENKGAAPLHANRDSVGPWEKFRRFAAGSAPGPVLAYVNQQYVSADSAGTKPLIAKRPEIGLWEHFFVEDLGNGEIALKSLVNGKYVCAEARGAQPLIANRDAVGPWETFKLVRNTDGTQSLIAKINGKYVSAESAGTKPLIASRTAIGVWERFDIHAL